VSEQVLTQTLQTNVYAYFLSQMVLLYPPIPATTPLPNVVLSALQQVQGQLNTLAQAQVIANCTETCEQTLLV